MNVNRIAMKFLQAILGLCAMTFSSHAQSLSQEVIGTAGNEMLTPSMWLSYTIGEPCTNYWNTGGNILTEGFQQNEVIITGISETPAAIDVTIYPNPFSASFTVDFSDNNKNELIITDATGRTVEVNKIFVSNDKCVVDMQNVAAGIYFLSILSNQQPIAVYRLVKSTL